LGNVENVLHGNKCNVEVSTKQISATCFTNYIVNVSGGEGHRLAEGNQLAPEMDGATRPAYDPNNSNIPPDDLI